MRSFGFIECSPSECDALMKLKNCLQIEAGAMSWDWACSKTDSTINWQCNPEAQLDLCELGRLACAEVTFDNQKTDATTNWNVEVDSVLKGLFDLPPKGKALFDLVLTADKIKFAERKPWPAGNSFASIWAEAMHPARSDFLSWHSPCIWGEAMHPSCSNFYRGIAHALK